MGHPASEVAPPPLARLEASLLEPQQPPPVVVVVVPLHGAADSSIYPGSE
jgi:hypothetical protein